MKSVYSIYYYVLLLAIYGCASQSAPTGGPKDEDPPVLLEATPKNEQLDFNSTIIELEFDEWIALNNINRELIITPRLNQEFVAKQKKTKVIIEFEQPLDSNTTYTLYFREGIRDLNEGNVPPNLRLTFSTGSYLDSMSLSGNIYQLFNNKKSRDMSVVLYDAYDTADIFSDPPLYLSKTDTAGNFVMDHLKQGHYKLYAYDDKNNNLTLESSSEMYGFYDQIISLDTVLKKFNIPIYSLNLDTLKLQSAHASGHYFDIKYNKYVTEYTIEPLDSAITIYHKITDENKTIKLYNTFNEIDSIPFIATARDTVNFIAKDTLYLKFEETKRDKDDYKISIELEDIDYEDPLLHGYIDFSKPSHTFITDSLFLFIDSLTVIPIDTLEYGWNDNFTSLLIDKKLSPEMFQQKPIITEIVSDSLPLSYDTTMTIIKPLLMLGQAAFISVELDSSVAQKKSIKQFTAPSTSDTGLIRVHVTNATSLYTLQLLDKKSEVVVEMNSNDNPDNSYTFKYLKAGEYKLRAMIDANNNGTWELGNMLLNTPPEPIQYFETKESGEIITLRANWEIGPLNFSL